MFKIVHDLSSLSEDQKKQYLSDYSVFLGLNPEENRLDMIWMTSDSVRALVAYCRRGTTDILRDIHGIDVTDLVKEDGPGYVSYKATGISRRGRKEIAVGAYSTTGLTGDRLAAAVATAQTRALRRLTLQFVGGGLLDESEVNREPVQSPASPVAAPAVQPDVKPQAAPGKSLDMSPMIQEVYGDPRKVVPPKDLLDALKPAIPASVEAANAIIAQNTTSETPIKKKRGRKPKNAVDMGESSVPVSGTIVPNLGTPKKTADDYIPESQRTVTSIEETSNPTHRMVEHLIDSEKIRNLPNADVLLLKPVQQLTYVPVCPDCQDFMSANDSLDLYICTKHGRVDTVMKPSVVRNSTPPVIQTSIPVPASPDVKPAPISQSPLTPDEQKSVKTRLSTFWVYILPEQGGMTSDDGLSINGKLIKYANLFYPDAPNSKEWTFAQWDGFINSLEDFNKKSGPKALVDHINTTIGAA